MTADPNNVKSIFSAASEKPQAERAAFLDQAVAGDAVLRARVEALLNAHDYPDSFLQDPAAEFGATINLSPTELPLAEKPGTLIGPYKLLEQIGEGGMGVVYMADQQAPVRRRVALKIIKAGMDTRQVIARFEAERQALALMDHANIARVLDAGATDSGRPYFVMELVRGVPITEYSDANNLPVHERLELFVQVCHAVQHAHQKGIIHRDLKPTNILVTLNDGRAVPKVIDFGVAKATGQQLTEKTLFTAFAQMVGTPLYMSPEQAEMTSVDIDTRSDIYSLGVLLYELLTGTTPFDQQRMRAAAFDEIRRIIREEEPPKPSTRISTLGESRTATAAHRQVDSRRLSQLVEGDLDWIVMKALEKDRTRRYDTAGNFAADVLRHLSDQPVDACPPSAAYRFRKFARRNRVALITMTLVAGALVLGTVISTWQAIRATRATQLTEVARIAKAQQRTEAERQRQQAEANEKKALTEAVKSQQVAQFLKDMLAAAGPAIARGRDTTLLREIVDKTVERVGKDLKDQPEVEAELRGIIGGVYSDLGEPLQGEAMFREALALNKTSSGGESLYAADLFLGLAWSLNGQGKPAEAEAAFRECVAIRRKLLGDNNLLFAGALGHLAFNLYAQGKLIEAEATFRQTLATYRKLVQGDHDYLAFSLNGLGAVLHDQGKLDAAEATFREALAMRRRVFGSDHLAVANTLCNLANVLQEQGKLTEAEVMFREAVATRRKLLGNDHPDLFGGLNDLAQALQGQGKLSEAEAVYREALTVQHKAAESAPSSPIALSRLAWFLSTCPVARLRDPGQAVALASQAAEIAPQEAGNWNTLGVARYRAGEWQGAVDALNKSMELRKRGEASDWFFLAMAHHQLGHKEEARKWYDQAVAWMDKNQPKNEELLRFRKEAAELLGISEPAKSTDSATQP